MANKNTEVSGYDLGSTGTLVELGLGGGSRLGWRIEGTGSVDYVVEIRGNDVGWMQIDSYTGVTSVDDGQVAPEALTVRIRNTTTSSSDTAEVLLGVDN